MTWLQIAMADVVMMTELKRANDLPKKFQGFRLFKFSLLNQITKKFSPFYVL
jgi:hypothetical protein